MSSLSHRAARSVIASSSRHHLPIAQVRRYAKAPVNDRPQLSEGKDSPYLVGTPIYPVPRDPYGPAPPGSITTPKGKATEPAKQYSETQKSLVKGLARLMGYNSNAVTAIRETGRMLGGIVEAIERDAEFYYGECQLPPTYQTFFQLHMLYLLILIPRLRTLPTMMEKGPHQIPEPPDPLPPHDTVQTPASASSSQPIPGPSSSSFPSTTPSASGSSAPIFTKPAPERYIKEIFDAFFELAESQMRRVLGRNERERVVQKYLREMAEQYKGTSVGMDVIMGLSMSNEPVERDQADAELASWLWRNLFSSRGLGPPSPEFVAEDEVEAYSVTELFMVEQLGIMIQFVRREMARLDLISDRDVLEGNIGDWGSVKGV